MVLRNFLDLVNLIRAQAPYMHKSIEVIMVGEDKDLIFAVFQINESSFKSLNNS